MKTANLEKFFNSFGKKVVNQARGILNRKKGGGTNLAQSIKFKVSKDAQGNVSIAFTMAPYGKYIDKGVSGTQQAQKYINSQGKSMASPFKFTTKQPPSGIIDKWVVKKGIAPRDAGGRFIARKSLVYLIARSIKLKGIKSLAFLQKPLGLALKKFGKGMMQGLKKDIEASINQ